MSRIVFNLFLLASLFSPGVLFSQTSAHPPLRIGIVGLVHGHVHGFLGESRHSPKIEIVGVAEPDRQLLAQAGTRYSFDRALLFPIWKRCSSRRIRKQCWFIPTPTTTAAWWKSAPATAFTS